MKPEYAAIARESLILRATSPEVCDTVLAHSRSREYDRGATIFIRGERANAIYIVAEGWVKLFRIAPKGSEAVVGVITKGQSFGEAVAFRDDVYPVSAEAVTDCTLIRIEAETILRLITEQPSIAVSILSATFTHLHSLISQVEQLKAQTGAQRVAEFLLELCDGACSPCIVKLPYDKMLIAGHLGLKPESLSRAFAKLRDHGVTIRQYEAEISDVTALRDYADENAPHGWGRG